MRLLTVEYCKYLAILGREAVLGLGPRATPGGAAKGLSVLAIRSLLYVVLFYLWTAMVAVGCTPILFGPSRWTLGMFHLWGRGSTVVGFLLRAVCGIRVEVRGREHIPTEARPWWRPSTFACWTSSPSSPGPARFGCFVMKKELIWIPWFGWYAAKVAHDRHRPRGQGRELR